MAFIRTRSMIYYCRLWPNTLYLVRRSRLRKNPGNVSGGASVNSVASIKDRLKNKMQILAGPRMTEAEKIYLKSLLQEHNLLSNYSASGLHIR